MKETKLGAILMRANNTMNPKIVGKTALYVAKFMAGITVPTTTRVLVSEGRPEVSHMNPFSREKLCPVLGFYVENTWENTL